MYIADSMMSKKGFESLVMTLTLLICNSSLQLLISWTIWIYNDPITDSFNPAAFVDEEYSDDEWDFIMLRSWSSLDGDYRFVDLHAQHEHLIVNTHMMVSPDAPDFNIGIDTLEEEDFDEDIWEDMQEFDDGFQQDLIDFNLEVADNLKQALSKNN